MVHSNERDIEYYPMCTNADASADAVANAIINASDEWKTVGM